MKYLLLFTIKAYWLLIPASKRKHCLFKQSCSHYVFQEAKAHGLVKGLKSLVYRFKNCKPGYQIINIQNETYMISANNEMFPISDLRDSIFN